MTMIRDWDGVKVEAFGESLYTIRKYLDGYYLEWLDKNGVLENNKELYKEYKDYRMQDNVDQGYWRILEDNMIVLEEHPLENYPTKDATEFSEDRKLVGKKFQVNGFGEVYKIISLTDDKYSIVNDSTPTDTECGKHAKEAVYRYFDEGTWVSLNKNPLENTKPIKSDGGSSAYYDIKIPDHYLKIIQESGILKVEQLIDIIFNNDFDFGCAFKALVRAKGITDGAGKEGNTMKYELNKIGYYSDKIEEKYNWSNPC